MSDRIEEFLARVESRPGDTLARFVLAREYFERGHYDAAVPHLKKLVEGKADWMVAWILLGRSEQARGDKAAARAALDQALALAVAQRHEGPEAEIRELLDQL